MIFDTSQRLAIAVIREKANLVEPDTGRDERSIFTFSLDLTLLQAHCLNATILLQNRLHGDVDCSVLCTTHEAET
jgi:hypothetical protein